MIDIRHGKAMRFLPVRAGAFLVELDDLDSTLSLMASLEGDPIDGIEELIPAARTVLVAFNPQRAEAKDLVALISVRGLEDAGRSTGPLIEIPVTYNGEDLPELATTLGLSVAEIIALHTAPEYRVAFTGFAPGFAYLQGLDAKLTVPRRKTPRTLVPAGSVAIASEFCGVYPKDSPGGWQLVGSTSLKMFDLEREPAALLQPGFRVRFIDAARTHQAKPGQVRDRHQVVENRKRKPATRFEIVSTLFPILVEDEGRPRQSGQGVSISGAADKASYRIANRLVGNKHGAAALEITLGQSRLMATGRAFVALAGAIAPVSVQNKAGLVREAGRYEVLALSNGDVVSIGAPAAGLRSYLSVRGGFDSRHVLGSASRDTLAGFGSIPLLSGATVDVLAPPHDAFVSTGEIEPFAMPRAGTTVTLDVTLGPRADWFAPQAVEHFLSQDWAVTPQSSRAGVRLKGVPLERSREGELPSEATVHGAIQVPASGQPVLFLVDHPLTGGYPVIANVAAYHLDLAGQLAPGSRVRFNALPHK